MSETPQRGSHAQGADKLQKQASQLAYDVKYKVRQSLGKDTKLSPAQVSKAYVVQLTKSPAPPAVKALAKKKLLGEEYTSDITDLAEKSAIDAMFKVFVEGIEKKVEEVVEEENSGDRIYKIRVTDKKTGNTYVRKASRSKIAELRANPNISSVEMTGYGDEIKSDGKNDRDGDGKIESPSKEHAGLVHNAIQKAKGGTPDGKDTRKEEVEVDEAMSSYDRNRKRAAQRAADRNAARAAGKTGVVPGVGYVTPRREKETYTDEKGTVRHKSGAKNEEVELDENRRAARSAGGYKDDSKKQTDPSKDGFTGVGNMSIDQIRKMSARMDKKKTRKEEVEVPSGDLKTLVKKAVKRVDSDVDGDVDHNDPKAGKFGEYVPSVDGKKRITTSIGEEFLGEVKGKKDKEGKLDVMKKGKNSVTLFPDMKEDCGTCSNCGGKGCAMCAKEGKDEDSREVPTKMDLLKNRMRAKGIKVASITPAPRNMKTYEETEEVVNEEGADSLKDRRMERGGVDGNNRYNKPVSNTPNTFGKKKPATGGMSALEKVKASIQKKYGKGAIVDTKKKK